MWRKCVTLTCVCVCVYRRRPIYNPCCYEMKSNRDPFPKMLKESKRTMSLSIMSFKLPIEAAQYASAHILYFDLRETYLPSYHTTSRNLKICSERQRSHHCNDNPKCKEDTRTAGSFHHIKAPVQVRWVQFMKSLKCCFKKWLDFHKESQCGHTLGWMWYHPISFGHCTGLYWKHHAPTWSVNSHSFSSHINQNLWSGMSSSPPQVSHLWHLNVYPSSKPKSKGRFRQFPKEFKSADYEHVFHATISESWPFSRGLSKNHSQYFTR